LELGAGIGLLATYCSLEIGSDQVKTFEANPFMLPLITKTFALNGVSPTFVIGAIGPRYGQIEFHVRENFWASSSHHGRAEGSVQTITVPVCALHDEIVATRPTYLVIDIEGAEENLVGSSELPGVKKVMVELHPELIGEAGVRSFLGWLSDLGFRKDGDISKDVEIYLERH
jgi:FkbM family methyltransferase